MSEHDKNYPDDPFSTMINQLEDELTKLKGMVQDSESTLALADRLIAQAVDALTGENNEVERQHVADDLVDFQNRNVGR